MKDAFKLVSWLSIITVTIACVISSLINDTVGMAIAFGIVGAVACGLWAAFLVYLFGVRRRIKKFLGFSLKNATSLEKEVGATRINDVRQALESLYKDKSSSTARYGIKFGTTCNSLLFRKATPRSGNFSGLLPRFNRASINFFLRTLFTCCGGMIFRVWSA